jgi:DNA-binding LacI/PurR family transcriptional regulator
VQKKQEISRVRDNKEQVMEEMRAKIEAAKEEAQKKESEAEAFLSSVGTGTIETLQANLITACNALAGIRVPTK